MESDSPLLPFLTSLPVKVRIKPGIFSFAKGEDSPLLSYRGREMENGLSLSFPLFPLSGERLSPFSRSAW